ncbi:hypothetical protein [Bordetella bronchiseptica]|uniref:hypothetical protein n=1 Tax=Bordetella bronchiseptica TaxID=518 RepID=UPI000461B32F|nr:hypothetical protein [Bordetella bronchiseptica]KDC42352.1 hypothetical protein L508_2308 [Bordetella bronchiseptica M435/02/3]
MMTAAPCVRVLLHAPTAGALERARSNAANLLKEAPGAQVRIVANAAAAAAALDAPPHPADAHTWLCPNTLARLERPARAPLRALPQAAVLALALLQEEGWRYIRA